MHELNRHGIPATKHQPPISASRPTPTCCHAAGYKLAADGRNTRSIQAYMGHRNIQNTVRYTALAPDRFKGFWRD